MIIYDTIDNVHPNFSQTHAVFSILSPPSPTSLCHHNAPPPPRPHPFHPPPSARTHAHTHTHTHTHTSRVNTRHRAPTYPAMNCFPSTPTELCYRPRAHCPQWRPVVKSAVSNRFHRLQGPQWLPNGLRDLPTLACRRISLIGGFPLKTCQLFCSVSDGVAIDGSFDVINVDVVPEL